MTCPYQDGQCAKYEPGKGQLDLFQKSACENYRVYTYMDDEPEVEDGCDLASWGKFLSRQERSTTS